MAAQVSLAINDIDNLVEALISGSDTIDAGGAISLLAEDTSTIDSIAIGLSAAVQSGAALAVFAVYVALIVPLIATEERVLLAAYGARYEAYRARTWRLVPLVY